MRSPHHRFLRAVVVVLAWAGLSAADVVSLTLINADTDAPVPGHDPIATGAVLDLATLPTRRLNLRANLAGSVGSVVFQLSGPAGGTRIESVAPYAWYGDTNGDYKAWTPATGSYQMQATPYTASGGGGSVAGAAAAVSFTVVDGVTPPPPPPPTEGNGDGSVTISGERKQWHRIDLAQEAVATTQDASPNPFLDYRFNVTFTAPSGKAYVVPGYFAGDGSGGSAGNVWMAHLNAAETGTWQYRVSFRRGTAVAVDLGANAGTAVSPFDGRSGSFSVGPSDKAGDDFRASDKGMLVNRGGHYLTYGGSGKPFLFTGPGIPENILGYRGFTNTTVGIGHTLDAHLTHWKTGDPDWGNGAGKRLIGALNYIADNGGNCLYLMSNTIGGDGKDCFPHPTTSTTKDRYDLGKLQQWDVALAHAQRKGIYLHWVLAETETGNYTYYGGSASSGSLSTLRKLSFRMLNARFGHYNGLKWNLMEEVEWVAAERAAQMAWLHAIDPYDHPVTFQTGGAGLPWTEYDKHLGNGDLDALSFQGSLSRGAMFDKMVEYRTKSANAGVPWTVAWDEPQKIENDVTDEANGYPMGRRDKMWPCLMGGADGFMWYIQADGGGHGFDQRIEDFTIMRDAFRWSGFLRDFLGGLPLAQMSSSRSVVASTTGEDYCLFRSGEVYAIYNDRAGTGMSLDLSGVPSSTTFTVRWFDPRGGGTLQIGSVASVSGGGLRSLGNAPRDTGKDWAILVERSGGGGPVNLPPTVDAGPDRLVADSDGLAGEHVTLAGSGSDSDGQITTWTWREGGAVIAQGRNPTLRLGDGTHTLTLTVSDDDGATASDQVVITVQAAAQTAGLSLEVWDSSSDDLVLAFSPLADGDVIPTSAIGGLSLVAVPAAGLPVQSVVFRWSGTAAGSQTENIAPYAVAGDTNGDLKAWGIAPGTYTVVATAYSAIKGGGQVLATVTRTFTLSDAPPAFAGR